MRLTLQDETVVLVNAVCVRPAEAVTYTLQC